MLKRLKFPEHGIDLAIDPEIVAYISKDQGVINNAPRTYTTIVFKGPIDALVIMSTKDLDSLAASKFHEKIIDALFVKE